MDQNALFREVVQLTDAVVADPRWAREKDDLGVSILGMLVYGFALMTGRTVMFLDIEDVDGAVVRAITSSVGAAQKWASGLVTEASQSAFDQSYHPGQYELIGVGHSYFGVHDRAEIVDNVFENIQRFRRAALDRA